MNLKLKQKIGERQVRLADLMMIFANHVTIKDEESIKATIVRAAASIKGDINSNIIDLHWCALLMVVFYDF